MNFIEEARVLAADAKRAGSGSNRHVTILNEMSVLAALAQAEAMEKISNALGRLANAVDTEMEFRHGDNDQDDIGQDEGPEF